MSKSFIPETVAGVPVRMSDYDRRTSFQSVTNRVSEHIERHAATVRDAVLNLLATEGPCRPESIFSAVSEACPDADPIAASAIVQIMRAAGDIAQHGGTTFLPEHATGALIGFPAVRVFPRTFADFVVRTGDRLRENHGEPVPTAQLAEEFAPSGYAWITRAVAEGFFEKISRGKTQFLMFAAPHN